MVAKLAKKFSNCRVFAFNWWWAAKVYQTKRGTIMTLQNFLLVWLPVIVSVSAFCFSIYNGVKNGKKANAVEIAERIARDTRTDMKLDEISKDVKEVKETVRNIQNDVKDHEGRIVKLEASYKAEHKRLDEIFSILKTGGSHDE